MEGMMRRAILAVALAVLAGAFFLPRCAPRVPLATPMPVPKAQAIASSSAAVTGTQRIEIRVSPRRPANGRIGSGIAWGSRRALGDRPRASASGPVSLLAPDEEIVIVLEQTIASSASSSAAASASVDQFRQVAEMIPNHGHLGVLLGTMPGLVALDVELARIEIPPWLLGVPLEMGLDLAGNLETGALGVSVGGKAYAMAGAWSTWRGDQQGLLLGVGMRF